MLSINDQLIKLYSLYWDELKLQSTKFDDCRIKPASPLLLQVTESEYVKADIRIMYCGQETKGWGSLSKSSMEERLERYRKYYLDRAYIKQSSNSVFWKGVNKFDRFFRCLYERKNVVNIWNNVSKIGIENRKGMTDEIRAFERAFFPVLGKEIQILKPDIIVFMSGPNRDCDIKFHFPDVKIEKTETRQTKKQLASVNLDSMSKIAIRTYHPNYFGGFNNSIVDAKALLTKKIHLF